VQTIKTGVVVALLLAVCYGAFIALNAPEPEIPAELLSEFDWSSDESDMDSLMNIEMPTGPASSSAADITFPSVEGLSGQNGFSPGGAADNAMSLDLTSNLPDIDTSNLNVPQLPLVGTAPNNSTINSPIANSANGDLPQLDAGPSTLPALPSMSADGGVFQAPDGPAIALNGRPVTLEPAATDSGPTAGQLISQTRQTTDGFEFPSLGGFPAANANSFGSSSPSAGVSGPGTGEEAREVKIPTDKFSVGRSQALSLASAGKLRDALALLTPYYESPELNSSEHEDLVDIMDALTREVIYSTRHLALPAYTLSPSDTLVSVAQKHQITPELLKAINRLDGSDALLPGSQLKVVQGPFRATIGLTRGELTLFLGDMYAGRFPVSLGRDPAPTEGSFEIVDRRTDRTYYGAGGKVLEAADPRNPYGGYWINLGQDLCIHGTPEMASSDLADAGCISLAPLDAADVYHILAQGCRVEIIR
jgi:hypothetical protein